MANSTNRKCARGFKHKWEVIDETATHTIQKCTYCRGKQWKIRGGATIRNPIRHIPARV